MKNRVLAIPVSKSRTKKMAQAIALSLLVSTTPTLGTDPQSVSPLADLQLQSDGINAAAAEAAGKPAEANIISPLIKPAGNDDKSCDCQLAFAGQSSATIEFETKETCHPDRNYLEPMIDAFAKVDPTQSFTKTRTSAEISHSEIQRKCVTFVMRSFIDGVLKKDVTAADGSVTKEDIASDSFAQCNPGNGIPRQGMMKPCVTEKYVNLMYNSFIDVADCMGLPQKLIVPKFLNESGFHLNAFGSLRIYDREKSTGRNLLDLRVCNPKNKKIKSFTELKACPPGENQKFLEQEDTIIEKLKNKNLTAEETKDLQKARSDLRTSKTTLRDIFDFKTAKDSFKDELLDLVRDKHKCESQFIERFCGSTLDLIGGDSGVGQFTITAMQEAIKNQKNTFSEINNSEKPSCKRIAKIPNIDKALSDQLENRCDIMRTPPNPIAALIHYGSFYRAQSNYIAKLWGANDPKLRKGKDIDDLMAEAKISDFDKDKLKEILVVFSYNAGPVPVNNLFANWLLYRIKNIKKYPIKTSDFSFRDPPQEEFKKIKAEIADKMTTDFNLLTKKKKKTPTETKQLARLTELKIDHLDFANYIRAYHTGLAKNYLQFVRDAANVLDKTFGKGVCTPKVFLEL